MLALNGIPDHVHMVVSFPPTVSISDLVKQVKGVSSHFVNETLQPGNLFKWQGSYGAFTVSRWDLERVIHYVKCQKERHSINELLLEWEEAFEEINL